MIKICEFCGKPFETKNGMSRYCDREHTDTCVVCGKIYVVPKSHLGAKDRRRTCSKQCASILRKQTNEVKYGGPSPMSSKEIQNKVASTNLERYGVKAAAQSPEIMDKIKRTNRERYGVDYYTQTSEYNDKLEATSLAKYGTQRPVQSKQVQDKIKSTNLKRYEAECVFGNSEIRDKCRQTYFDKTGYYEPFANPDVQSKIEDTNLNNLGVRRPLQSDAIKSKYKSTNVCRYGVDNPMKSADVQYKSTQTSLERYGTTNYMKTEEGKQKFRASMNEKYGVDYFSQSERWKQVVMLDPTKSENLIKFREDPKNYLTSRFSTKPNLRELAQDLGISDTSAGQIVIHNSCQQYIDYVYSYMETEVFEFLSVLIPNHEVQQNTHKIITPYELDIYIPDFKIGIECNPTATHNSSSGIFNSPVSPDYHKMKTDLCNEAGVFLFHIFGHEWTYKKDIIKSMLANLLGKTSRKIFARNTIVKEVAGKTAFDFLQANHRQGGVNCSERYGLYLDDELVALMTFSKARSSIGSGDYSWELVRFCNLQNTSVIGGASKLFRHFLSVSNGDVISFSDRAHTRGTLYERLGFQRVRESSENYVWVDSKTDKAYHRLNAQKQNIEAFLHDSNLDLSKSEKQLMEEHGYLQVFDSGTTLWKYSR